MFNLSLSLIWCYTVVTFGSEFQHMFEWGLTGMRLVCVAVTLLEYERKELNACLWWQILFRLDKQSCRIFSGFWHMQINECTGLWTVRSFHQPSYLPLQQSESLNSSHFLLGEWELDLCLYFWICCLLSFKKWAATAWCGNYCHAEHLEDF